MTATRHSDESFTLLQGERGSARTIADFLDAETIRIDAIISAHNSLRVATLESLSGRIDDALISSPLIGMNQNSEGAPVGHTGMRSRCFSEVTYGVGEATNPSGAIPVLGMGNISDNGSIVGTPGGY